MNLRRTILISAGISAVSFLPIAASHAQETAPPAAPVVLRSAVVTLKVPDFNAASRQIRTAAQEQAGTLDDARTTIDGSGRRSGWVRLHVPADHLPALIARLHSAGSLYSERLKTEDDASRYDGLALRADRLQQHAGRLASVLTNERRLRGSDVLFVQERLFRASVDESLLRQDRLDLARKARSSSLLVFLFEPTPTGSRAEIQRSVSGQFAFARQRAMAGFTASFRRFVTVSAYATVYAPLWIAVALFPLLLLLRFRAPLRRLLQTLAAHMYSLYRTRVPQATPPTQQLPSPPANGLA